MTETNFDDKLGKILLKFRKKIELISTKEGKRLFVIKKETLWLSNARNRCLVSS